jgi:ABC-type anion transport system duplicated permease subunit
MNSRVQVHSAGGPCTALLVVSILQVILLGLCGFVASVPEWIQRYSLDQDSWIAWLALEFTMLTVIVSMAVGCALGVYTAVLGIKRRNHDEGIQPVVRSLAHFYSMSLLPQRCYACLHVGQSGSAY